MNNQLLSEAKKFIDMCHNLNQTKGIGPRNVMDRIRRSTTNDDGIIDAGIVASKKFILGTGKFSPGDRVIFYEFDITKALKLAEDRAIVFSEANAIFFWRNYTAPFRKDIDKLVAELQNVYRRQAELKGLYIAAEIQIKGASNGLKIREHHAAELEKLLSEKLKQAHTSINI